MEDILKTVSAKKTLTMENNLDWDIIAGKKYLLT